MGRVRENRKAQVREFLEVNPGSTAREIVLGLGWGDGRARGSGRSTLGGILLEMEWNAEAFRTRGEVRGGEMEGDSWFLEKPRECGWCGQEKPLNIHGACEKCRLLNCGCRFCKGRKT